MTEATLYRPITTSRYVDLAVNFLEEWLNSDAELEDDSDGSEYKSIGEVLIDNLYLTADNSRPLRVVLPEDIKHYFIRAANVVTNAEQFHSVLSTFVEIVD